MQEITVDEEFRNLLPVLDDDALKLLEENLLENGCRDALVLWNGVLIDGHNRYDICTKLDIPYTTVDKEFESRDEVVIWIITTQVARRNLNPKQLSHYRGLHYRTEKKIQGTYVRTPIQVESYHNDNFQKNEKTAGKLSKIYKVSGPTILRDAKASEGTEAIGEVSPKAKRMILTEEVRIDKKDLVAISAMSKEEVAEIALSIEEGKYEKMKPENSTTLDAGGAAQNFTGTWPLDLALSNMTEDFYSSLRRLTKKNGDSEELKVALRICIDILEDLYRSL